MVMARNHRPGRDWVDMPLLWNNGSPEGWIDGEEDDTEFPDQNGDWDEEY